MPSNSRQYAQSSQEDAAGPMSAEAVQDASAAFKKALIERALGAEMSHHLGYPAGAPKPPRLPPFYLQPRLFFGAALRCASIASSPRR